MAPKRQISSDSSSSDDEQLQLQQRRVFQRLVSLFEQQQELLDQLRVLRHEQLRSVVELVDLHAASKRRRVDEVDRENDGE